MTKTWKPSHVLARKEQTCETNGTGQYRMVRWRNSEEGKFIGPTPFVTSE